MSTPSPEMIRIFQSAAKVDEEILQSLNHLLQTSMEFIHADACRLELYNEHKMSFDVIARVGKSAAGPQQAEGMKGDFRDPTSNDLDPMNCVVSVLSTPLLHSHGKLVGIISAHFCRPHRPSKYEFRFLGFCGEQAAHLIADRQVEQTMRAAAERLAQQNDELQRLNATLSRSNQDLERFAFAAGHDLQEPLRMIGSYAQLLQRSGGTLDGQAAMFVATIAKSARRMSQLVADLLTYAEIGASGQEPLERVDLNLVVDKVLQNLKMAVDENCASVSKGKLPILAAGHECHFVQLFQNLIGNALKYRRELAPRIGISAQEVDGTLEFAVADNGLGVGSEHHGRIFEAFQRLHDNQSPGTGMGLAICQRIVERYGGRIWVESEIGRGSTFRFVLPNARIPVILPVFEETGTHMVLPGGHTDASSQSSSAQRGFYSIHLLKRTACDG